MVAGSSPAGGAKLQHMREMMDNKERYYKRDGIIVKKVHSRGVYVIDIEGYDEPIELPWGAVIGLQKEAVNKEIRVAFSEEEDQPVAGKLL